MLSEGVLKLTGSPELNFCASAPEAATMQQNIKTTDLKKFNLTVFIRIFFCF
jgi:hypothetical protein